MTAAQKLDKSQIDQPSKVSAATVVKRAERWLSRLTLPVKHVRCWLVLNVFATGWTLTLAGWILTLKNRLNLDWQDLGARVTACEKSLAGCVHSSDQTQN